MISIMSSYPGFHALPRGIKQLLVASESNFFDEAIRLQKGGADIGSQDTNQGQKDVVKFKQRVSSGFSSASWN